MEEINGLVASSNALDFCYGQPQGYDMGLPMHMRQALTNLLAEAPFSVHLYEPRRGRPDLLSALAKFYSRSIGRTVEPTEEILVTIGATQALHCAILTLVGADDEVILLEPAYECYKHQVADAKGRLVTVQMQTKDSKWSLPMDEFESKFNDKTKMLILNTPHNPTGKVFTKTELERIANLCKKFDVYCLSDEVYDCYVHEGIEHVRMASLEGMWDRTLTVGSAGKLFGVTGWRIGWVIGPKNLVSKFLDRHEFSIACSPSILQNVIAKGLQKELPLIDTEKSFWNGVRQRLIRRQIRLTSILEKAGMNPISHGAGYFVMVDITDFAQRIGLQKKEGERLDFALTKWLCTELQIGCFPGYCFYSSGDIPDKYIRFHYIVPEELLDELEKKFEKLEWFHQK